MRSTVTSAAILYIDMQQFTPGVPIFTSVCIFVISMHFLTSSCTFNISVHIWHQHTIFYQSMHNFTSACNSLLQRAHIRLSTHLVIFACTSLLAECLSSAPSPHLYANLQISVQSFTSAHTCKHLHQSTHRNVTEIQSNCHPQLDMDTCPSASTEDRALLLGLALHAQYEHDTKYYNLRQTS